MVSKHVLTIATFLHTWVFALEKKETAHLRKYVAWTGQGSFQSLPLFLLHGLLPHSHILHVFLQTIQRGIWLDTNPIVMVLGVSSS